MAKFHFLDFRQNYTVHSNWKTSFWLLCAACHACRVVSSHVGLQHTTRRVFVKSRHWNFGFNQYRLCRLQQTNCSACVSVK